MFKTFFGLRSRAVETNPARRRADRRRARPVLEGMEDRVVLSHAGVAAVAHAEITAFARMTATSRVHVAVPITITNVAFTSVTQAASGALTAVGTVTGTLLGHQFTSPVTATLTPGRMNAAGRLLSSPILDLSIQPIHLSLLGLNVDTSPICLNVSAQRGRGQLLGNLLSGLSGLLTPGADLTNAVSTLNNAANSPSVLNVVNSALSKGTAKFGSPTVSGTPTNVLNLSVGPVNLNLLGLKVKLDNCSNGPVTVSITATPGGGILGNLLSNLSNLLNTPGTRRPALVSSINAILSNVTGAGNLPGM